MSRPSLSFFAFLCGVLVCAATAAAGTSTSTVNAVRIWGGPDSTRVVFELSAPVDYRLFQLSKPDRVVLDLDNGAFGKGVGAKPGKGVVKDMRIGHFQGKARIVLDLDSAAHPKSFLLTPAGQYGYRLVVDLGTPSGKPSQIVRTIDDDVAHGKPRPVVIAVDAGHGGDDPGARGQGGTLEKSVTLEIAKDLAKLIDAQSGMHAVLTRKGDYFVPLEKRFQIAREHKADLFVSIHANSCPDYCDARGASVWVTVWRSHPPKSRNQNRKQNRNRLRLQPPHQQHRSRKSRSRLNPRHHQPPKQKSKKRKKTPKSVAS